MIDKIVMTDVVMSGVVICATSLAVIVYYGTLIASYSSV